VVDENPKLPICQNITPKQIYPHILIRSLDFPVINIKSPRIRRVALASKLEKV
jgi:hypothetical protein